MTKDTRITVGQNVRTIREEQRITVSDAADAVGVHRSWWNYLENGAVNFTIDKLDAVARFLKVAVLDLLDEETVYAQSGRSKAKRRKAS